MRGKSMNQSNRPETIVKKTSTPNAFAGRQNLATTCSQRAAFGQMVREKHPGSLEFLNEREIYEYIKLS
jgi:hypothetical protein